MKLDLPSSLSAESISAFSVSLHQAQDADEYVIDFGRLRFFSPFSMLLVSANLRRFRQERPHATCNAINFENHSYAAHMGCFKSFGLDFGNAPGEALGSETHIPLQDLNTAEIKQQATARGVNVGVVLEERAAKLAKMLVRQDGGDLVDTLTFSIREILRNVVEHSESPTVSLCAQWWPSKGQVEVGILDCGRGIRAGLADNPHFEFQDDRAAIQMALMPGVSGNTAAGWGDDPWQNSGYGLYMTSRICRRGGSFVILSGSSGIKLNSILKTDISGNFRGTAVRLLINTRGVRELSDRLAQFRQDGLRAAKRVKGALSFDPSSASQMLSRDFQD
jgi:hypothetical protein